jgi:hypothetical protein
MEESFARFPELTPFDAHAMEGDDATICALDDGLRITYVNSAWREFARANGAPPNVATGAVGLALLAACPPDIRPFYEELFRRARAASAPVEHSYECSSPATFRRCRMRIFRCDTDAFVVAHSLSQAMPHHRAESPATEQTYRNDDGIISQCTNCRRVRRAQPGRVAVVLGAASSGATVGATVLIPTPFTPESLLVRVREALAMNAG